jgi:hypothetical protein
MYGIKYFFLNKNNQTILRGGGKNKFQGKRQIIKNTIFQNSDEVAAPDSAPDRP